MPHRDKLPDLTLPEIATGSHGSVWDLKPWLYFGGAGINRRLVDGCIKKGNLGDPLLERLDLVDKIHERLKTLLIMGRSHHYVKVIVYNIASFFSWSETHGSTEIRLDTVDELFLQWADYLWDRVNIKKNLKKT